MSKPDYYKVLDLPKTCTAREIKKAYHKLARKHHPDKGGDAAKFKEITTAHEVLSNEEKRENYDKYGDEDGGGNENTGDIFSQLFRGGQGRGGAKRKQKGKDAHFPLKIGLKDFYTGTTRQIKLKKNILCPTCNGKGGRGVTDCGSCGGKGHRTIVRQLGPGMIQQMQSACGDCNGKGEIVPRGMRCVKCKGQKVLPTTQTLDVNINRGMSNGEKIIFHGEGEQAPGITPGNVVVVLEETKHPDFRREGNHLFVQKKISLKESICGFKFVITHLDDRRFLVASEPGKVYQHGDTKCLPDEGIMDTMSRGNLYVEFEVEFKKPSHFSEEQKRRLRSLLPRVPTLSIDRTDENVQEVQLIEVDIEEERRRFSSHKTKNQYDEDDDQGHGGGGGMQGAQCQTQ